MNRMNAYRITNSVIFVLVSTGLVTFPKNIIYFCGQIKEENRK